MCQYSASADGAEMGFPNDWHRAHLSARAVGGAGLVFVEATAVAPEGRITSGCLGLWNTRQRDALATLATLIEQHGAVPGIQIAHAGRKASTSAPWEPTRTLPPEVSWKTVGPDTSSFGRLPAPACLDEDEIASLVEAFAQAARWAGEAGFRVLEIHGAHGYLIHSFLSPHSNSRIDAYGASWDGRARFALEVVEAVREAWPADRPLSFRLSATDWLTEDLDDEREGWTLRDTVRLAKHLQARGVDLLDVSSGGLVPDARIPVEPGYQVSFARTVREETGMAVGAVGMITTPSQAEGIVSQGDADAVLLGRQLLREPYWPRRAARELGVPQGWPKQYAYAVDPARRKHARDSASLTSPQSGA